MWHPDKYLEQMYRNTLPKYQFQAKNELEWRQWRDGLREQFIADLGGFPDEPAPLDAKVIEETACDGYVRQRVEMTTYSGLVMPAYILVPSGSEEHAPNRRPAVVACHGHGYGSKEIVGLEPDGVTASIQPGYQKNFAVELVRRGFIVIVPELLGFGDRRQKAEFEQQAVHSCHSVSTFLLQMGHTMSGHRVYETMRAIDCLQERPDVDPNRIGIMGISGGGLVASFTAALDDRVRAAVVSGYVNTFKDSILSIHHCIDNYIPGLNRHAEMPDIVSLIAPRPLLIEAGRDDTIFPVAAVIGAYERIREAYRLLGAEIALELDIFDGDHQISGKKAYDLLAQWLA